MGVVCKTPVLPLPGSLRIRPSETTKRVQKLCFAIKVTAVRPIFPFSTTFTTISEAPRVKWSGVQWGGSIGMMLMNIFIHGNMSTILLAFPAHWCKVTIVNAIVDRTQRQPHLPGSGGQRTYIQVGFIWVVMKGMCRRFDPPYFIKGSSVKKRRKTQKTKVQTFARANVGPRSHERVNYTFMMLCRVLVRLLLTTAGHLLARCRMSSVYSIHA